MKFAPLASSTCCTYIIENATFAAGNSIANRITGTPNQLSDSECQLRIISQAEP